MNAVFLSFESPAEPCWVNGLGALTTSGSFARSLAAVLMAVLRAPLSSVPDGTWKTIGFLPFCCGGNRSASRSVARWLSVPGRLRSLVVSAPTRPHRHHHRDGDHDPRDQHQQRVPGDPVTDPIEETRQGRPRAALIRPRTVGPVTRQPRHSARDRIRPPIRGKRPPSDPRGARPSPGAADCRTGA